MSQRTHSRNILIFTGACTLKSANFDSEHYSNVVLTGNHSEHIILWRM